MNLENLVQRYVPKSIRHATITGALLLSMAVTTFAACTMPPSPNPYNPTPTIKPSPTPLDYGI